MCNMQTNTQLVCLKDMSDSIRLDPLGGEGGGGINSGLYTILHCIITYCIRIVFVLYSEQ